MLNLDLTQEILVRLPIKYLIQLKLICKDWNSFICSAEFARIYQQHHLTNDHGSLQVFMLCRPKTRNIHAMPVPATPPQNLYTLKFESSEVDNVCRPNIYMQTLWKPAQKLNHNFHMKSYPVGSCNGLICLMVGLTCCRTLYLWNPAIQESYCIERLHLPKGSVPFYWGFGYDSFSDDYKVIVVGEVGQPSREPFAEIYTLRTNRWRRVKCLLSNERMREFMVKQKKGEKELCSLPVQVGQFLYWRVEGVFDPVNLLAFDLTTELFEIVPLPKADARSNGHKSRDFFICQLKQCLCACWLWNESGADGWQYKRSYVKVCMLEGCGDDRGWKSEFKFRGLECYFPSKPVLPKLFELKEHGKFVIPGWDLKSWVVVDQQGERHYPPRMFGVQLEFSFNEDPRYVFEYTQTLASPTHYLATKMPPMPHQEHHRNASECCRCRNLT